ncbi:MAG: DUF1700 domain-containing protein [Clostridia bacterium]|nr:DUF1700 domain-containing protein [Clostridia bacterium]
MKKYEFLAELQRRLDGLSADDLKASLDYYAELIDDRIDDGMNEDEAVASVGTPADAAAQILEEMPISKLVRARAKPKKQLGALAITLIILGSPIWLSLAITAFAVAISVAAVVFSVWVSLWSVFVALAGSAVGCIIGCPFVIINNGAGLGLIAIGVGLCAGGLSIFAFHGCAAITKLLTLGIKKLFLRIKRGLVGKETLQ